MNFTNAEQVLAPHRTLTENEILRALRLDIAAELDAINLYQSHIEAITDPRVQSVFARIRDDEKEHVAQFMTLLSELDTEQADKMEAAKFDLQAERAPLLNYPNIAERVADLDRRVAAFGKRVGWHP